VTRDEYATLPPMIALGLIWDMARPKLEPMPRPQVPSAPRYDGRLSRGTMGFLWMSEMDLGSLEWWERKKRESAEGGGQYADRDKKGAAVLQAWIAWRKLFPHEVWSGTRGEDRVTAAPPSREPVVRPWPKRDGGPGAGNNQKKKRGPSPDDDGRGEEEEYNGF
jgi:hypothetical protein